MPAFSVLRSKTLLLISLCVLLVFSLTAVLHPSSPVVVSSASQWLGGLDIGSATRYHSYPPNLPDRTKGGWGNLTFDGERRKANATFVVLGEFRYAQQARGIS